MDFVFSQRSFDEIAFVQVASNYIYAFELAGANEFRLRHPVSYEANQVYTVLDETFCQPPANKAGCAGEQD